MEKKEKKVRMKRRKKDQTNPATLVGIYTGCIYTYWWNIEMCMYIARIYAIYIDRCRSIEMSRYVGVYVQR